MKPDDVFHLLQQDIDAHGDRLLLLKSASLPKTTDYRLYYGLDDDRLYLYLRDASQQDVYAQAPMPVKTAGPVFLSQERPEDLTVRPYAFIKASYSPTARGVSDLLFLSPGPVNEPFGGARPLSSMLAGSLAGAGLGYLGGTLAENLLGPTWVRPGRLRKLLALAGGLSLTAPGAYWAYSRAVRDGDLSGLTKPACVQEAENLSRLLPNCRPEPTFLKAASAGGLFENPGGSSVIPVDDFGRVVWSDHDPFTPASLRAATMGVVQAASLSRDGTPWVTPADIARIGIGMGSGYASGSLAGRTLGVLAGLQPDMQKQLQQAGLWAGALKAVVPSLFGG